MVISPGVPTQLEALNRVRARGVRSSGNWVGLAFMTAPIVAVTGTNGKKHDRDAHREVSSGKAARAFVGGNLGIAASEAALACVQAKAGSPAPYGMRCSGVQLSTRDY